MRIAKRVTTFLTAATATLAFGQFAVGQIKFNPKSISGLQNSRSVSPQRFTPQPRFSSQRSAPRQITPQRIVPQRVVPQRTTPQSLQGNRFQIAPNTRVPNTRVPNTRVPNTRVPNTRVPNTRVPNTRFVPPKTRVPNFSGTVRPQQGITQRLPQSVRPGITVRPVPGQVVPGQTGRIPGRIIPRPGSTFIPGNKRPPIVSTPGLQRIPGVIKPPTIRPEIVRPILPPSIKVPPIVSTPKPPITIRPPAIKLPPQIARPKLPPNISIPPIKTPPVIQPDALKPKLDSLLDGLAGGGAIDDLADAIEPLFPGGIPDDFAPGGGGGDDGGGDGPFDPDPVDPGDAGGEGGGGGFFNPWWKPHCPPGIVIVFPPVGGGSCLQPCPPPPVVVCPPPAVIIEETVIIEVPADEVVTDEAVSGDEVASEDEVATDSEEDSADLATDESDEKEPLDPQKIDLVVEYVQLVREGDLESEEGPSYRVWFVNKGETTIDRPFDVALLASNEDAPTETSPFATKRVAQIEPGERLTVEIQLPAEVLQMGTDVEGNPTAFKNLFAAVDTQQELEERDEDNNALGLARTEVPPEDLLASKVR